MMINNLERHLHSLLDGRISFGVFAAATHKEFERLALSLLRRWVPPAWYVLDDVVQELLLGAWTCLPQWCPTFGITLSRYVVYNSMSHAKRALHKARGAKLSGTSDKNPSRFERPLSSFGVEGDGDAMAETILAEDAVAERTLIEREEETERREEAVTIALGACRTATEHAVILAIAGVGGADTDMDVGVGVVADAMYSDIDTRIRMRIVSEEHARQIVIDTAVQVAVQAVALAS